MQHLRARSLFAVAIVVTAAAPGASLVRAGEPPATAATAKGPWELVSDSNGVRVQRRSVAGSNLKEFQGRGLVEAPVGRVLGVIRDSAHRTEWMPQCAHSFTIEENEAARVQVSYQRTAAPWPVSDRDANVRAHMQVDPVSRRLVITFEGVAHPKGPPVDGVVRMPFVRGHWILTPRDQGRTTDVEYQVHADPGGRLPDWVSNLASRKLPELTITNLREQVKRRQYPALEAQVAASNELQQMVASDKSAR